MYKKIYFALCYWLLMSACNLLPSQNEDASLQKYGGVAFTFQMDEKEVLLQLLPQNDDRIPSIIAICEKQIAAGSKKQDFQLLFFQEFHKAYPNEKLASLFTDKERLAIAQSLLQNEIQPIHALANPDKIEADMPDDKVAAIIRKYSQKALQNCYEVMANRLNKSEMMLPSMHLDTDLYQIKVLIPHHPKNKNTPRLKKYLLQDQRIAIWETYRNELLQEGLSSLQESNSAVFGQLIPSDKGERIPVLGYAFAKDTAVIMHTINEVNLKEHFPAHIKFMWAAEPEENDTDNKLNYYALIALNGGEENKPVIDARNIVFAKADASQWGWNINFNFDTEGTKLWAEITDQNIGKNLAIVQGNHVLSYPMVQNKITGGGCQISGNFSATEAKELADILNSGYLAMRLYIVEEKLIAKKK